MKNTDKFLIAIVAGVVVLIVAAFAVALTRPKPAYQSDDTAQGVAHNYLFALNQKDYDRAYGYLSTDLKGYPDTVEQFRADINDNYGYDTNDSREVVSSEVIGNKTIVTVQQTSFSSGGMFNSNEYTQTFEMTLHQENGGWKITTSGQYWAWCWDQKEGCQ